MAHVQYLLKPTKPKCKDTFVTLSLLPPSNVRGSTINLLSCTDPKHIEDGIVYKRSYDVKCIEGIGGATPEDLTGALPNDTTLATFIKDLPSLGATGPTQPTADFSSLIIPAGTQVQITIAFDEDELDIAEIKNCSHGTAHLTITGALDLGQLYTLPSPPVASTVMVNLLTIPVVLCLNDIDIKCCGRSKKQITLYYTGSIPLSFIPISVTSLATLNSNLITSVYPTIQLANARTSFVETNYDICFTFKAMKHCHSKC